MSRTDLGELMVDDYSHYDTNPTYQKFGDDVFYISKKMLPDPQATNCVL